MDIVHLDTDLLIIGGGAAGCFAAVEAKAYGLRCLIMEKAHIQRSGCLAMGLNSINAYINPGESPQSYLDYVRGEFMDLVRDDLVLSIAQGLNDVVRQVEEWGLPIEKLSDGSYKPRGKRGIRVKGERLKPILAQATKRAGVEVLNRVAATNLILSGGRVAGAFGVGVRDGRLYVIRARGVIVAAGGASGIYKSYNPDSARHLMWYCPWNVGTGYAMGIRAGAEMTSFENRFIALRVKGVQAPTGTLALGAGARQINARGEPYLEKYYKDSPLRGSGTYNRLLSTLLENEAGRGPCYMDLGHLSPQEERQFKEDLLNMSPTLALLWMGRNGNNSRLEISGSEPYIVGGHGEAGYWIDVQRRTTLPGLYAAGDVAGGAPKKYVSGAWVEGRIAARTALGDIKSAQVTEHLALNLIQGSRGDRAPRLPPVDNHLIKEEAERVTAPLKGTAGISPQEIEERLQGLMDQYAGGFSTRYEASEEGLLLARESLKRLQGQADTLKARDYHELVSCLEVMDRIDVARVVVEHLLYRKETRWPCSQSRRDYPARNDARWLRFVNSVMDPSTGEIKVLERELK